MEVYVLDEERERDIHLPIKEQIRRNSTAVSALGEMVDVTGDENCGYYAMK